MRSAAESGPALLVRSITHAVQSQSTGLISINGGTAGIYFLGGQPRHAFAGGSTAIPEGSRALADIVLHMRPTTHVLWTPLELIPHQNIDCPAGELLDVLGRFEGTGPVSAPPSTEVRSSAVVVPTTLRETAAFVLLGLIALPISEPYLLALVAKIGVRGPYASFVMDSSVYTLAVTAIWWLVVRRHRASWRNLGIARPSLESLLYVVPIAIATLAVAGVLLSWETRLFAVASSECSALRASYNGALALAVIIGCIIGPAAEEFVFRGFVFGWLRSRVNLPTATILSSLFFAGLHAPAYGPAIVAPIAVLGVVVTLSYHYSESLGPPILIHALFNLYGILQFYQRHGC